MTLVTKRLNKARVQVDLSAAELSMLDLLQHRLAVRSRADLLQQAYGTFLWVVDEMLSGRRVVSVDPTALDELSRYKELSVPAVGPVTFQHYRYLIHRASSGRQQLYLKGRNMTVGQLIYKIRANHLDLEEAAADMDLPVDQVREAMAYYHTHRSLIESEMDEDQRVLQSRGVELEPEIVSR